MTPEQPDPPPSVWGPLWPLGEALRFLTLLPVLGLPPASEQRVARSLAAFPLAGLVIGTLLALVGALASLWWGAPVRAVVLVVAWGIITAGLHLDGLSDTFDAVLSWRSTERKLEIMKDSRIGAMGALALIALLALKVAWLHDLGPHWLSAVLLAPALGRWTAIYAIYWFPAARVSGLGHNFRVHIRPIDFTLASATALLLALLLGGAAGLVACGVIWATTHTIARWWTRDLGGLTGDTYGALCEIAETIALAVLAAAS